MGRKHTTKDCCAVSVEVSRRLYASGSAATTVHVTPLTKLRDPPFDPSGGESVVPTYSVLPSSPFDDLSPRYVRPSRSAARTCSDGARTSTEPLNVVGPGDESSNSSDVFR